ncbi:MAG: hypothetical protein OIF38_06580 [Cellvibrionaceae bacterium]|nr:hypothetical protein [Cellvibrionaceae bacterium]
MSYTKLRFNKKEKFTCLIELEDFDEDGDLIEHRTSKGISLNSIIEQISGGKLRISSADIYMDFDENSDLKSMEIISAE